jgi:glycosyltransferase involved in cell wall biosynthesis
VQLSPERRIVIVAPNISQNMGGEALKVFQYVQVLLDRGLRPTVVAHERCRSDLADLLPEGMVHFVEDDPLQRALWRSVALRFLLNLCFHLRARRLIRDLSGSGPRPVLHYVCPIAPLEPRLVPRGWPAVIGPLNGNISYPPAFRTRAGWRTRLHAAAYGLAAALMGALLRDERRRSVLLVSGGQRTLDLLHGVADGGAVLEVPDAGVATGLLARPAVAHRGRNPRFYACARLVDYKGIDLAIRAVAQADADIELDVIGDGEQRKCLEALARELGVEDRVHFRGWLSHSALQAELRGFRGLVHPALSEANGIAIQEAMAGGLPAIVLRWGGPEQLCDAGSGILLDPTGPVQVVEGLADAMNRLAADADLAERLGTGARRRAEHGFAWEGVSDVWGRAYDLAVAQTIVGSGTPAAATTSEAVVAR